MRRPLLTRRRLRVALGLVAALALAGAAVARWVLVPYRIQGGSMLPTLVGRDLRGGVATVGDIVLVNRWAYAGGLPARWDVVVLAQEPPEAGGEPGAESVKRVVGLPGEHVEIRDGRVWIDGAPCEPPAALRSIAVVRKERFGLEPVTLGPGEHFCLGDNSYLSTDSRRWGPIRKEQIRGRVELILLPFERSGRVR